MTDNRTTELTATERLRALLDERGVKYETADGWWTSWDTDGASSIGAVVYCEDLGSGLEIRWHTITPEQVIAATQGSEREKELEHLVKQLWYLVNHRSGYGYAAALESIEELGIEVDE